MNINKVIAGAVCKLLRPLVRILLRNNVPHSMFCDFAKWVYVDVALREFQLPGRKRSISRVALLTGLSRKEVLRAGVRALHPAGELARPSGRRSGGRGAALGSIHRILTAC